MTIPNQSTQPFTTISKVRGAVLCQLRSCLCGRHVQLEPSSAGENRLNSHILKSLYAHCSTDGRVFLLGHYKPLAIGLGLRGLIEVEAFA